MNALAQAGGALPTEGADPMGGMQGLLQVRAGGGVGGGTEGRGGGRTAGVDAHGGQETAPLVTVVFDGSMSSGCTRLGVSRPLVWTCRRPTGLRCGLSWLSLLLAGSDDLDPRHR
jgi:hypothetical protein